MERDLKAMEAEKARRIKAASIKANSPQRSVKSNKSGGGPAAAPLVEIQITKETEGSTRDITKDQSAPTLGEEPKKVDPEVESVTTDGKLHWVVFEDEKAHPLAKYDARNQYV